MPKVNDNFLRGWARQLRAAIDDGGELAYECAELMDEALGLIEPSDDTIDGDDGGEVGLPDGGDGSPPGSDAHGALEGSQQSDQSSLPGLVGRDVAVQDSDDSPRGVPRGTRGGPHPGNPPGVTYTVGKRKHASPWK